MVTAAFTEAAMNMTSAAVMGICLGIACFHFFIASVANVLEGTLLALRPINHLLLLFSAFRGLLTSLLQIDLKFKNEFKSTSRFRDVYAEFCLFKANCVFHVVSFKSPSVIEYLYEIYCRNER